MEVEGESCRQRLLRLLLLLCFTTLHGSAIETGKTAADTGRSLTPDVWIFSVRNAAHRGHGGVLELQSAAQLYTDTVAEVCLVKSRGSAVVTGRKGQT